MKKVKLFEQFVSESTVTEGMSKSAIKKAIKVIDKQIDTETGGDGEPLDNETLQALEQERERLLGINEAVNASGYLKAGKLGYNDQFLGRRSLSWTLSVDLGLKSTDQYVGPWLGFDHVSLYAIGKKKEEQFLPMH